MSKSNSSSSTLPFLRKNRVYPNPDLVKENEFVENMIKQINDKLFIAKIAKKNPETGFKTFTSKFKLEDKPEKLEELRQDFENLHKQLNEEKLSTRIKRFFSQPKPKKVEPLIEKVDEETKEEDNFSKILPSETKRIKLSSIKPQEQFLKSCKKIENAPSISSSVQLDKIYNKILQAR